MHFKLSSTHHCWPLLYPTDDVFANDIWPSAISSVMFNENKNVLIMKLLILIVFVFSIIYYYTDSQLIKNRYKFIYNLFLLLQRCREGECLRRNHQGWRYLDNLPSRTAIRVPDSTVTPTSPHIYRYFFERNPTLPPGTGSAFSLRT